MEDFIKKMVEESTPEIEKANNEKWIKLSVFLYEQRTTNQANEFRLFVNDDDSFYVHPFDKDGDTLDGKLFD